VAQNRLYNKQRTQHEQTAILDTNIDMSDVNYKYNTPGTLTKGHIMAHRKPAGRQDSSIFRRAATTIKKINIAPKARRGGTCL